MSLGFEDDNKITQISGFGLNVCLTWKSLCYSSKAGPLNRRSKWVGRVANNEILLLGVVSLPHRHLLPTIRTLERKGWIGGPEASSSSLVWH